MKNITNRWKFCTPNVQKWERPDSPNTLIGHFPGIIVFAKCDSSFTISHLLGCIEESDPTGVFYRGEVAVTKSGRKCQRWDSQSPNTHEVTPEK